MVMNRIEDIENTLLSYHRQTDISKQIGWFHDIIQGSFYSAAYLGDAALIRKYFKIISERSLRTKASMPTSGGNLVLPESIDSSDMTGMSALHWAVIKGHEVVVRILLDRGADADVLQKGMNSPLVLADAFGHETIARLLIECGAEIHTKNHKGHDALFMAVLYGHATKGLPWLVQLFTAKGMNLNHIDNSGSTPLHLCAEKNLARPVRMLVDSGADVNSKHDKTQLTPLQIACNHAHPDVETVRSFLDKGAYPNWRDLQGRSAFELALRHQTNSAKPASFASPPVVFSPSDADLNLQEVLVGQGKQDINSAADGSVSPNKAADRWRAMEDTIHAVGDWAVRALPALLELSKKGARFDMKDIESLRPSFKAAVLEAKEVWEKKSEPSNFVEFVQVREQSGEDLRLHKKVWSKEKAANSCQLCSDPFGLMRRPHHCRGCAVLCCDKCSSKRLHLTSNLADGQSSNKSGQSSASKDKGKDESHERVCDGCFNRLCHEASQPSPDHFRVRQLKHCALDLIHSIEELIDSLDDPDGDPSGFHASIRETANLTKELDNVNKFSFSGKIQAKPPTGKPGMSSVSKTTESLVEVLRLRESRLFRAEDIMAKFLEAADGYHRISKRLIEQKLENNRLWGSNSSAAI
jgi:ankyrin repeat protein